LQDQHVSVGFMAPPIVLAMAKQQIVDEYKLGSLRIIMSGAAPLGSDLQQAASERLRCPIVQAWGMTETSPLATCCPLDPGAQRPGSVGVCVAKYRMQGGRCSKWQRFGS